MRDLTLPCFITFQHPDHENAYEFTVSAPSGRPYAILRCIATTHDGWDHVSVTVIDGSDLKLARDTNSEPKPSRVPSYDEMCKVHRLFFNDNECAIQLHVPSVDHVDIHPFCLHLWRPNDGREIPRPPKEMVG